MDFDLVKDPRHKQRQKSESRLRGPVEAQRGEPIDPCSQTLGVEISGTLMLSYQLAVDIVIKVSSEPWRPSEVGIVLGSVRSTCRS